MANSKILGEPFDEYVSKQIEVRQNRLGTSQKTADDLKVFNVSTPWIRLSSSVSIDVERAEKLAQRLGPNVNTGQVVGHNLAKNLVLFAGSSEGLDSKIRGGLTRGGFSGAYGFLSDPKTQGYKPMPGISNISVNYKNNGSLKQAQVNIKCFSKGQFEALETLYLRLGYTLILEWGHSIYYNNGTEKQNMSSLEIPNTLFTTGKNVKSKTLTESIAKNKNRTGGNYDAMIAKVGNFSWELNNDLSYDIVLNLVSVGDIIDSLKMNLGGASGDIRASTGEVGEGLQNILNIELAKDTSRLNSFLFELTEELDTPEAKRQLEKASLELQRDKNKVTAANEIIPEIIDTYTRIIKEQQKKYIAPYDDLITFLVSHPIILEYTNSVPIVIAKAILTSIVRQIVSSDTEVFTGDNLTPIPGYTPTGSFKFAGDSEVLFERYRTLISSLDGNSPPRILNAGTIKGIKYLEQIGLKIGDVVDVDTGVNLSKNPDNEVFKEYKELRETLNGVEKYLKNLSPKVKVVQATDTEEEKKEDNSQEIQFLFDSINQAKEILGNLYYTGFWKEPQYPHENLRILANLEGPGFLHRNIDLRIKYGDLGYEEVARGLKEKFNIQDSNREQIQDSNREQKI